MSSLTRRILSWVLPLVALVATVVTTWRVGILQQDLWNPRGLQRLEWTVAAWCVWTLLFVGPWRRWFVPCTVAVATGFVMVAEGPRAVLVVAGFLLSAEVLGRWCFGKLGVLSLVGGAAVWLTAFSLLAHFPVNYPVVYVALLAFPFVVRPQLARAALADATALVRPGAAGGVAAWSLLLFPLVCHLMITMKPEMGADALSVHLAVPAWVAAHHVWPFDVRWLSWSVMPLGADFVFTAVYLPGGEYAARLLNFCFLGAVVFGVVREARRFVGADTALVLGGLFASTPLVQLVTGSLLVENVQASLILGAVLALVAFRERGEAGLLRLTALLVGSALATKVGSVAFVAPVLVCAGWEMRRWRVSVVHLWPVVTGFLPFAYAWAVTGNPIFPFSNNVFKSPYFDTHQPLVNWLYTIPLTGQVLWQLLLETHRYLEGRNGAMGVAFPVLLAVGCLLLRRGLPYVVRVAAVVAVVGCFFVLRNSAYLRYTYPALPLVFVAVAFALQLVSEDRRLFRGLLATLVVMLGVNIYLLPSSGWYHGGFFLNPFVPREAEEQILVGNPTRKIVEYLNQKHDGAPVAFFGSADIAGLRGKAWQTGWHTERYAMRVIGSFSEAAYGKVAREYGISLFLAPVAWTQGTDGEVVGRFLRQYTETEYTYGLMELRRLVPGAQERAEEAAKQEEARQFAGGRGPACEASLVDDASGRIQFAGEWQKVAGFGEACGVGTLTFTAAKGAEASFAFEGTAVDWVFTKANNRGLAEVWIDGKSRGRVDLFAPCLKEEPGCHGIVWHSRVSFDGLAAGPHVLKVRVLGEKRPEALDSQVDVDGFVVR